MKFLHPWLAYKDVDWDAALVQAIPKVSAAKDAAEYAAAVAGMLAALGDPATELVAASGPPSAPDPRTIVISWPREGVLFARLDKQAHWTIAAELAAARVLAGEIEKADAVVLDLREAGSVEQFFQEIGPLLVSRPLRGPSRRHVMHSGYRPQEGPSSAGFETTFVTQAAETFAPRPDAKPRRVVFVLGPRSPLPEVALALLAEGQASLLAEGVVDERIAIERQRVPLADGVAALVRTEELLPLRGFAGPRPDAVLAAGEDATEAALRLLDEAPPAGPRRNGAAPLPDPVFRPDRKYPEMTYPSREYRLLALYRFWNVIDRFYPYKQLLDDWAPVLPEFVPRFEAARDAREYALVVAELAARVADGHTRVFGSPALNELFGAAAPPFAVRVVEGQVVVTEIEEGAGGDAVAVGDVVLEIDGEATFPRMKRLEKYVAASTREWRTQRLAQLALRGPAGSAVLSVRGKDGQPRRISVARGGPAKPRQPPEAWQRSVPDNLGYVDLRVLGVEQVDAMFEALKDTRGLLFDMRGYPQSPAAAAAVVARLEGSSARYGASLYRELVAPGERTRLHFQQELPRSDGWKYAGKTAMLIDDRAISEAERAGLFFEAAADTRFVGTRSAGADGELTRLVLPGGLVVFITGQEVRHADGRQLQRFGLQPHVDARPTLQGVREGRDEVLERGLRTLRDGS